MMMEGTYFWTSICLLLNEMLTRDRDEYFTLAALGVIIGLPFSLLVLLTRIRRNFLPVGILAKKQNISSQWLISINTLIQVTYEKDSAEKQIKMLGYMSSRRKIFEHFGDNQIYVVALKEIEQMLEYVEDKNTTLALEMLIPCYQKFLHCLYFYGLRQSNETNIIINVAYAILLGDMLKNPIAALLHLENNINNPKLSISNQFIIFRLM